MVTEGVSQIMKSVAQFLVNYAVLRLASCLLLENMRFIVKVSGDAVSSFWNKTLKNGNYSLSFKDHLLQDILYQMLFGNINLRVG